MRWKTGILTVGIVGAVGLLATMGTSYVADRYAGEGNSPDRQRRRNWSRGAPTLPGLATAPPATVSPVNRLIPAVFAWSRRSAPSTRQISRPTPHTGSGASAWLTSIVRYGLASPMDVRSTRRCLSRPTTTPRPRTLPRFMSISSKASLLPSFQTARVISVSHSRCVGR